MALRRILFSNDTFSAQQIYQSMIMSILRIAAIIVLDGQSPARAWSALLKNEVRNHFPEMQSEA